MDGTDEGLKAAAAAREALKQKKRTLEQAGAPGSQAPAPGGASAKRPASERPPPSCTHEVAVPPDFDAAAADAALDPAKYGTMEHPHWSGAMAKQYPFALDPFQSTAVACVERGESVLVAAHTSAGKTVVAEYAIAKAFANDQHVVYTSPLKALSNQKYRELAEEFSDVGLMTGDVTLNPSARCMVMTTEILRSMIYRGSEFLRDVGWVIFDEVHYMQDRERGVVWEETIIFMPPHTRMVFLSATLPNAFQFAQWVSYVHQQPCHVVYTDYRPTPLAHYGFPMGGKGLHLLVDERGNFRQDNFERMREIFKDRALEGGKGEGPGGTATPSEGGSRHGGDDSRGGGGRGGRGGRGRGGRGDDRRRLGGRGGRGEGKKDGDPPVEKELQKIVSLIQSKHLEPAIVFSFSRRECEAYSRTVASSVDFNTSEEKEAVTEVFTQAIQQLGEEDRDLPFITAMLPMLQAGVAVHHSGLLPILKELAEILFQEGLIKCLFSTETFAMGLNMPARTCIFTALKKWDGEENRWIGSGEYIQMSGRAGRRGKDDRGLVILMVDDSLDEETARSMMKGKATPLLSSFKLSYYTLLNLMRRIEGSGVEMEDVIAKSFAQFQHEQQLPQLESDLRAKEAEIAAITAATEAASEEYTEGRVALREAQAVVSAALQQPQHCLHFLRPGRIVRVVEGERDWGYGVVVSVLRKPPQDRPGIPESAAAAYLVDTLLCCKAVGAGASASNGRQQQQQDPQQQGSPQPAALGAADAEMQVIPVPLPLVTEMCTLRITLPADLRSTENRRAVLLTLRQLVKQQPADSGLPLLDPVADFGIDDEQVAKAQAQVASIRQRLAANPLWQAEQHALAASRGAGEAPKPAQGAAPGQAAGGTQAATAAAGEGTGGQAEDPFHQLRRKAELLQEADQLKRRMKASQLGEFRQQSKSRGAVLRKLDFVDKEGMVTIKGRAACEIDTADELLAAELMLNGTFGGLNPQQLAALVSCLVDVERSNDQVKLTQQLAGPLGDLQDAAKRIAEASKECGLEVDVDAYIKSFRPTLMDVIHAWSSGATFAEVCDMTEVMEGVIIRAARRLDELMQQLERAARVVGDNQLGEKFAASRATIRRGIMFSASLYL